MVECETAQKKKRNGSRETLSQKLIRLLPNARQVFIQSAGWKISLCTVIGSDMRNYAFVQRRQSAFSLSWWGTISYVNLIGRKIWGLWKKASFVPETTGADRRRLWSNACIRHVTKNARDHTGRSSAVMWSDGQLLQEDASLWVIKNSPEIILAL